MAVLGCDGISWTICKQSAPRSRQITTPTPRHSVFTGRMLFLAPNQQCQSTEGSKSGKQIDYIDMSLRGAVTIVTGTTVSSALSVVSAAGIAAPAPVVVVVVIAAVGSVAVGVGHSHDVTETRAFPSRESRPVDDVTAQITTGIRCSR